jgi:hypothetical protein
MERRRKGLRSRAACRGEPVGVLGLGLCGVEGCTTKIIATSQAKKIGDRHWWVRRRQNKAQPAALFHRGTGACIRRKRAACLGN